MNISVESIYILFYVLSQNKKNIVKSLGVKSPSEQDVTLDSTFKAHPGGLEIITEGSTGPNDPTKYKLRCVSENESHYIFNKGVKCIQVRADGETLWKAKKGDFSPGALSYYHPDEICINFSHDLIVLYYRRSKWRPWDELLESEIESLKPDPFPHNPAIILNICSELDSDLYNFIREDKLDIFKPKEGYFFKLLRQVSVILWQAADPSEYASAIYIASRSFALIYQVNGRFKFRTFIPDPQYIQLKNKLVTLDIDQRTTDYIKYVFEVDFLKFRPKRFNLINKIVYGSQTIWEAKNDKYAKLVTLKTTGNGKRSVRVFFPCLGFDEIEIKFHLTDVDIGILESTDKIEFRNVNETKVFAAKKGYLFKSVNENGVEIWCSEKLKNHSSKVTVTEHGNITTVRIDLEEAGELRKFVKNGVGMPWNVC